MKERSRTHYSLVNISVGFLGYFFNTLIGFLCRMFFVRTLPQAYLGLSGLFSNIFNMLSLAELGIGTAIVYALYKPLAENDEERITILVQFYGKAYKIIGFIIGIIGCCLMPMLNSLIKNQPDISESLHLIYFIFLFNTASTYFFSYKSSVLSAAQKNYIILGVSYVVSTLQSIFQIIILLITKNYIMYLIIQTIGTWIFNITISVFARKEFPCIERKTEKKLSHDEIVSLTKNVKSITIMKISEVLVNGTDNIIITYFNGLNMVGATSNYTLLSGTLASITNQVFNSLTASVGNYNALESKEKRKSFFRILNMANFWVYGWATIGIFIVSSDIVELIFGKNYVLPLYIPFILAVNFYVVSMQHVVTMYRTTLGLFYQCRYILIFTAGLNLIFSFVLGQIWGVFGVYLATLLARLLTNNWYMPYIMYKYGLEENPIKYFKQYIFYTVLLTITGIICYGLCSLCKYDIMINIVLKIFICSIMTNTMFFFVLNKTEEYTYLSNKIINILINFYNNKIIKKGKM